MAWRWDIYTPRTNTLEPAVYLFERGAKIAGVVVYSVAGICTRGRFTLVVGMALGPAPRWFVVDGARCYGPRWEFLRRGEWIYLVGVFPAWC